MKVERFDILTPGLTPAPAPAPTGVVTYRGITFRFFGMKPPEQPDESIETLLDLPVHWLAD